MGVTSHWVSDKDVTDCSGCDAAFGFLRRKHHCRSCGGVFCHGCSSEKRVLVSLGYENAVRVCDSCASAEDGVAKCKYDYDAFDECGEEEEEDFSSPTSSESQRVAAKYDMVDEEEEEEEQEENHSEFTSAPISFKTDSDSESSVDRDDAKPSNHHSRKMNITTNTCGVTIWSASASLTNAAASRHAISYKPTAAKKISKSYQSSFIAKRVTFSM
eukprot:TRINITY_DN43662_c0_g1_i1.p1 TRINITY_DN43662_c0_g1~~TRINITY_DN43662_c0_g1_i1.p1  ORF type:complete len:237 (+),score=17.78 TRINITY_DN43662_c0_g1_i1:68-712(+)